ncbi:hypothetical protein [Variovorax sp. LjRoot178]|uniref:hypothetical protein n=1 Tax=Variovorax sp. LjRoot178 TaxID=3342277 RepID=UPI003ED0D9B7
MAKKTYFIPSLFTKRTWRVDVTAPSTWTFDFKQWHDDSLLNSNIGVITNGFGMTPGGGAPGHPPGLVVEKFSVNLARTRSHNDQLDANGSIRNLAAYNPWTYISQITRKLECGSVLAAASGAPWMLLLPSTKPLGREDIVTPQFASALAPATYAQHMAVARLPAFVHRLQEAADPDAPWYVLEATGDQTPDLGFDQINHALRETRGTATASLPFHGAIPTFSSEDPLEMLSLSRLKDRSTSAVRAWSADLMRLVPATTALGKTVTADLNWFYPYRDASIGKVQTGFTLRGTLKRSGFAGEFAHRWDTNNPQALALAVESLIKASDLTPGQITAFKMENCSVVLGSDARGKPIPGPWIRMGSIDIQPVGGAVTLEFQLFGEIGTGATAVYPKCNIAGIRCNVRTASGADPVVQWSRINEGPEPIRRETEPIVAVSGTVRQGTLNLDTRFEGGRHANTRLELEVDGDADPGSALWLNLRPFVVAKIGLPRSTKAKKLLVWSSDDPEGAQWRVDDPEIRVVLPPQAVGEEMERGSRFYEPGKGSPIDPSSPVRYRFSRPTYLTLSPSPPEENRRFEKSSINFRQLIRGAIVKEMVVEMAYPLEVQYKQTRERTIKLTEVGEFIGQPTELLEVDDDTLLLGRRLSDGLRSYLDLHPAVFQSYKLGVTQITTSQEVAWNNYVSRLAELYIHDPTKPRGEMRLTEGVTARLRSTKQGATALANPLPADAIFDPSKPTAGAFRDFIHKTLRWAESGEGSLRGGLIHSFEFPSEMVEVLDTPEAVNAMIETLCLSALGASGKMEASFASGKTTFAVTVAEGQLSRLVKTRLGRIGALWNRAKHVVVYDRTATLPAQFKDEQASTQAFDGWPLLRKTEEYIEPTQLERVFAQELDAGDNATGFIHSSFFATQRIYVNGAWARDLGDGYELPLWDPRAAAADPKFYPKPQICLECFGESEKLVRLWFAQPHLLYFYSSSASGTDSQTDKWKARAGVDFEGFLPRWPAPKSVTVKAELPPSKPANARLSLSSRFDLAVEAEGPVNLQHSRGETPMLVVLQRVSISRTSQKSPVPAVPARLEGAKQVIETVADIEGGATAATAALESMIDQLKNLIDRQVYAGKGCADIQQELLGLIANQIKEVKKGFNPSPNFDWGKELKRERAMWVRASSELTSELLRRGTVAEAVLVERMRIASSAVEAIEQEIASWPANLDDKQRKPLESLAADLAVVASDLGGRADKGLREVAIDIDTTLRTAASALTLALQELNQAGPLKDRCLAAETNLSGAIAKLDGLPPYARKLLDPAREWVNALASVLHSSAQAAAYVANIAPAAAGRVEQAIVDLTTGVNALAAMLSSWAQTQLLTAATRGATALQGISQDLSTQLNAVKASQTQAEAQATVAALKRLVDTGQAGLLEAYRSARTDLEALLQGADGAVADAFAVAQGPLDKVSEASAAFTHEADAIAVEIQLKLEEIVNAAAGACDALLSQLQTAADEALAWARHQADAVISDVLSSEAARQIESYAATAEKVWDVGNQAISLARAVGDLPKMTPLEFDINVADYVFDGKLPSIKMSPAVARLQQQGEKLLESLGISVPCEELLDQLVPNIPTDAFDFNQIFQKFAGMDFEGLFKRFRLPKLDSNNVAVKHGFDKKTRRAWVDTTVKFAQPQYEELFGFGPVALGLEKMKFDAFTGVETSFDELNPRTPVAKTRASLLGDWILLGGGQRLVTFHDVNILYDGASGFDFAVSPNNIELHPALSFVSDFVKQFKKDLPPAIEIIEDKGKPVGVRAGTTIVLDDLPDLGAVKIGPIDMRSSLGLKLDKGRFVIDSAFSLGNKQLPIFVQITWLGGGCWLESQVSYIDGNVVPSLSIGLSLGATRGFNLASVASGSFSVMLYCYIEMRPNSDRIAIGLSLVGSATIVGFVNANLNLLLEAQHGSGQTTGTGRLDVAVKISWVYTFRYKTSVKHKF